MTTADLKPKIIDLLAQFRRAETITVTSDTVAKCLHVAKSTALQALNELLVEGLVEYGRKNPASTQPRFQLTDKSILLLDEKAGGLTAKHRRYGGRTK